jgi:1,4-alpha-glucan branching enzyme
MNRSIKRLLAQLWATVILATPLFAQVVTTVPAFPTEGQQVTIYFNANEGNRGLANFTGDVYAHTGVLTNLSTSASNWRYVVSGWLVDIPKAKLERIEPNLYRLVIPDIRAYYNVPANETIQKLAFVFRSAAGVTPTREGKATGNADIFVDMYSGGVNVRFIQPADVGPYAPLFTTLNAQIPIFGVANASGSTIATMKLQAGNQTVLEVQNDTLQTNLTVTASGRTDLRLIAVDNLGRSDTTSFYYIANPQPASVSRPGGLQDGITYDPNDPTKATLSLFAPGKQYVYVIGDMTGWQVRDSYLMNRHELKADSVWHWLTISGLEPGVEYGFQYLVDGSIRVADPYATKILDPWNDSFISATTYPNLKPYPVGKTTNIVGVLNTRPAVYEWQTTGFTPPPKDKLVIYELLVRDFLSQSNYQTLLDTLDYLQNLGVNAIEFMPVKEFEGNISWGYNPMFFLALDKAYGTPHAFKRFIDEAHSRGIAIILDQVLNHAFGLNPLVRLWWDSANNRPASNSPYFNPVAKHDFNVGYDFNHESKATQYFVDRVNRHWIEEYRIDGYRFDLSKGFTQVNSLGNVGFWGQYDASRVRLLKRMADRLWEVKPNAYVILEHFADNNEERELGAYGMMLWNNTTSAYQEASMGWVNTSNISNVHHSNRGFSTPALISYMESHDEQWIMLKNRLFGNSTNVNHDVKNVSVALQRQKLTGAFFFPVPGPKMLWQFGELGYGGGTSECLNDSPDCANPLVAPQVGRTAPKPIRWEYRANAQRYNLYRTWAALIRLKTEYPAFSNPSTYTQSMGGAVKSYRMTHPDFDVSVIGNFGVTATDASITFSRTGTWFDYFTGSSRTVNSTTENIRLEPGEFRIFTTTLLPTPPAGILTDIEDRATDSETPSATALIGNYPNPFNPTTVVGYQLAVFGPVRLAVYDILGREVAVLVDGAMPAGRHSATFDASGMSSGVYLIRMQAGTQSFTRKMMLVK